MNKLVGQLREFVAQGKDMMFKDAYPPKYLTLLTAAADEIEKLESTLVEVREAAKQWETAAQASWRFHYPA
jgi:hypothetical protein